MDRLASPYISSVSEIAPPPDFRLVWCEPAASNLGLVVEAVAMGTCAGALSAMLVVPGAPAVAGAVACAVAFAAWRRRKPWLSALTQLGTPAWGMAIVPWGLVVHETSGTRVIRWSALREVDVKLASRMDGPTPVVTHSEVSIATRTERFRGRALGAISLERLMVYLDRYAWEASREVAVDLSGTKPLGAAPSEPQCEQLIAVAHRFLRLEGYVSERSAAVAGGYRLQGRSSVDLTAQLLAALDGAPEAEYDPRPLAAILASEIGCTTVMEKLTSASTSPHVHVAAVCRAAALRLHAPVHRIGSLAELSDFLPAADTACLEEWLGQHHSSVHETSW